MKQLFFIVMLFFSVISFGQEIRLTDPSQVVATPDQCKMLDEMVKEFENPTGQYRSKCVIQRKSYNYIAGNGGPQTCTTYELSCDCCFGTVYAVQTYNGGWVWSYPTAVGGGQYLPAVPYPCN